jgi:hypothetical protein
MQQTLLAWLAIALGGGCHTAPTLGAEASALLPSETAAASSLAPSPSAKRRPTETTPEVVAKATEILWANASAMVGTEFPFELNGKHYIARMEMHDNPDGDPGRPQGEHKGVTVYTIDE